MQLLKQKIKAKTVIWSALILLPVLLIIWTLWANTAVEMTVYEIKSSRLPKAFSGFRIAQISDLHNDEMGNDNKDLIGLLQDAKPDIIVITGDMIDSYDTHVDIAIAFAEKAVTIAPCYYVSGNHESRLGEYAELKAAFDRLGVTVLEDETATISKNGETINIVGIIDPSFKTVYKTDNESAVLDDALAAIKHQDGEYTILLSHRPEMFEIYAKYGIDLVFSGHAHGGQFRLPFVGGLYAPSQGVFPKYDAGVFTDGNTSMVVSRGIGNSSFPLRFNNRPELVLAVLTAE